MSSRRYIKRVWRVPKDRGALVYFAALLTKALVKHGWPVVCEPEPLSYGVMIKHVGGGPDLPPDLSAASEVAVRIVARTYRLDVTHHGDFVFLNRFYFVAPGGHFREDKTP